MGRVKFLMEKAKAKRHCRWCDDGIKGKEYHLTARYTEGAIIKNDGHLCTNCVARAFDFLMQHVNINHAKEKRQKLK